MEWCYSNGRLELLRWSASKLGPYFARECYESWIKRTNFTADGFTAWGTRKLLEMKGKVLGISQILKTYYLGMDAAIFKSKGSQTTVNYPQEF